MRETSSIPGQPIYLQLSFFGCHFFLLSLSFSAQSFSPLQAWERRITACCLWAPSAHLKQACFMIDLPFLPSFSAYRHVGPFKWRANQADSLTLSHAHSFPPSDKTKEEQGGVLGEFLMPYHCPGVAETQCVHWLRVSTSNCTLGLMHYALCA